MKEKYGIFGTSEFEIDENGFIDRLVIIQASGLFASAPPNEMRIHELIPFNDKEWGKQWTAKLNRKTDLPFYLATVKVKLVSDLKEITDEDNEKEGIELME